MSNEYVWEKKVKIQTDEALRYIDKSHQHNALASFIKIYWDYLFVEFSSVNWIYPCHTEKKLNRSEELYKEERKDITFYTTLTQKGKAKIIELLQE